MYGGGDVSVASAATASAMVCSVGDRRRGVDLDLRRAFTLRKPSSDETTVPVRFTDTVVPFFA